MAHKLSYIMHHFLYILLPGGDFSETYFAQLELENSLVLFVLMLLMLRTRHIFKRVFFTTSHFNRQ